MVSILIGMVQIFVNMTDLSKLDPYINRTLIIDGILVNRDAKSPTLVREMLLAYLPEKHRHTEGDFDEAETAPAKHLLRRRETRMTASVPAVRGSSKVSLASASLRQALHEIPEIAEASKHIILEDTKDDLNIELVDQNGRSIFLKGSDQPYEYAGS